MIIPSEKRKLDIIKRKLSKHNITGYSFAQNVYFCEEVNQRECVNESRFVINKKSPLPIHFFADDYLYARPLFQKRSELLDERLSSEVNSDSIEKLRIEKQNADLSLEMAEYLEDIDRISSLKCK